ncbi:DUF3741-associated sequence motif protein [Tanacetum coccineum]
MENDKKTTSVMAKLMCLDETSRGHQSVSGNYKVLSDNYLQKSSSIGKRARKNSLNNHLGSKRRVSRCTNDLSKETLPKDCEQKDLSFDRKTATKIVVLRPNLGNVRHASGPFFLNDSRAIYAWEVKKQLLEKLKMTKVSQELRLDFGSLNGIRSKEGLKYESVTKLPIFKPLNLVSTSNTKSMKSTRSVVKPNLGISVNDMTVNTKTNHSVPNSSSPLSMSTNAEPETEEIGNYLAKEGCSSHMSDISSEHDSPIRSLADGSVSSNCVQVDGKVRAYQRSPSSVLETPFREDNSSSPEYCETAKTDLHGLWMQLQLLKSESEENDIDPEMVTSSDDEMSYTSQTIKSPIPFGGKESRDFSYLVDVLDESGFQDGDVEIRFDSWHSSECMAGPSVFETLEKKYGKQELWHKAERKLLFDRINNGMMEIVRPRLDLRVCSKLLRRKMNILRRDVIEDELSVLLLTQENGVNDGVSEKAVGRETWFDPVDEVDSLVREIEIFLFDELVAELVSTF